MVDVSTGVSDALSPASHTVPVPSTAPAKAISSAPESMVFCHSCTPFTSRPVSTIFVFVPLVFRYVITVLPEISNPSAPCALVRISSFFMAMLFVAALAIGFKVIVDEASAKIRSVVQTSRAGVFIIAQALQRDVPMPPLRAQQSLKFLLHQILQAPQQLRL